MKQEVGELINKHYLILILIYYIMPKKNIKRKTRKKKQKGGTLFKIHSDDLDCLEHVGRGSAEEVSCGACAINQIGFPADIVDKLSFVAGEYGGVHAYEVNDWINELSKNLRPEGHFTTNMYVWGADKDNLRELAVESVALGKELPMRFESIISMTGPYTKGVKKRAIHAVFATLKPGTKSILGIWWALPGGGDGGGHFVSIAKSHSGTPYLVETQHLGFEGVYRGWDHIKGYFDENQGGMPPAFFVTFNNSAPIRGENKRWSLDFHKFHMYQ